MTVYECGNFSKKRQSNAPDSCPVCDSPVRDRQPDEFETVSVTCPGWKNAEEKDSEEVDE